MWWSWNARRKTDPVDVMLRGPEKPTGAIVVEANWRDNPWFTPASFRRSVRTASACSPTNTITSGKAGYITVAEGAYTPSDLAPGQERKAG
jgi:phage terminase large subunit